MDLGLHAATSKVADEEETDVAATSDILKSRHTDASRESSNTGSLASSDVDGDNQEGNASFAALRVEDSVPRYMADLAALLGRWLLRGPTQLHVLQRELRPVLPDPILSLGEVEACVKPHRPDGLPEPLGLFTLDEPTLLHTDGGMLILRLRACLRSREGNDGQAAFNVAGQLGEAERRPREVEAWVAAVKAHHRQQTAKAKVTGFDPEASVTSQQLSAALALHASQACCNIFPSSSQSWLSSTCLSSNLRASFVALLGCRPTTPWRGPFQSYLPSFLLAHDGNWTQTHNQPLSGADALHYSRAT